jgi:hypothetical protein
MGVNDPAGHFPGLNLKKLKPGQNLYLPRFAPKEEGGMGHWPRFVSLLALKVVRGAKAGCALAFLSLVVLPDKRSYPCFCAYL